ncbi:MAG: DUF6089 family protein [Muribaculaceae bacterium]|nr:DUF6089 family protein [Muribaculaceae bacterium]
MKKVATLLIFIAMLMAGTVGARAQESKYKFDFGAQVGMSGYLGDASSSIFAHPGFAGGVSFRYLPDVRWAIRTQLNVLTLSGDTKDMDDVYPDFANYSFKSTAYDLGARLEWNWFSYGIGETYKKMRRWSPYLAVGVGFTLATCEGEANFGFNIPMAFGIKYKLNQRVNFSAEFSMTKVFNDHVDGPLSDLHQIRSSFGRNTDWYSNIQIAVSYEFGERCQTCHYVD